MVVFCGTAVGAKSAEVSAYYAGPGNKFWRTLHAIGLTPRVLAPHEYPSLLEFGVGLTDLVKSKAGSDAVLANGDFGESEFAAKIRRFAPRFVGFNGKRAAQEYVGRKRVPYGPLEERIGHTQLFVLPSTSGAANGYWEDGPWHELGEACKTAV
jgi:TDG/mug DNA glycosylase family protein